MAKVKDKYNELYDRAVKQGCTPKAAELYADTHRFDENITLDGEAEEEPDAGGS